MKEFNSGDIIKYVGPSHISNGIRYPFLFRQLNRKIRFGESAIPYDMVTAHGELSTEFHGGWYIDNNGNVLPRCAKYTHKYPRIVWWVYGILYLVYGIKDYLESTINKDLGYSARYHNKYCTFNYPNILSFIVFRILLLAGIFPSHKFLERLDIKSKKISM